MERSMQLLREAGYPGFLNTRRRKIIWNLFVLLYQQLLNNGVLILNKAGHLNVMIIVENPVLSKFDDFNT